MKHPRSRKFSFLIPVFVIAGLTLLGFVVMLLWNGVLVDVLSVKTITFWQALGILVLSKILFSGFGPRGRRPFGPPWRRRAMIGRMRARWAEMSPEERETMRDEMRRRFGDWPRPPWCDTAEGEPQAEPGNPA